MDCAANAQRCPETMRLLGRIPGMKTAFFSILSPHKHIPAHRGAFNGILRLHLALLVPGPREQVRIRIGNEFRHWTRARRCSSTTLSITKSGTTRAAIAWCCSWTLPARSNNLGTG